MVIITPTTIMPLPTCEKKPLSQRVGKHQTTNRCCQWTKFTKLFSLNAVEIVVDNTIYRLSISPSVPEIFALKVHACTDAQTHARTLRKHNASGHYVGGNIKTNGNSVSIKSRERDHNYFNYLSLSCCTKMQA